MKTCVALLYKKDGEIITDIVAPNLMGYSKKIGADFKIEKTSHGILHAYNLLVEYDRVIVIGSNVIVRDDAPNLFDIVPNNKIGALDEGHFRSCTEEWIESKNHYKDEYVEKWEGKWYNCDIMVISRQHRHIFKNPHFYNQDDTPHPKFLINRRIQSNDKIEVELLSERYNRLHFMDEKVGTSRLSSYFINYAGGPIDQVVNVMGKDLYTWSKCNGDYSEYEKRNILALISAGMGDQICAEPVIRYMKDNEFKDDNIIVVTHHPRLFNHIEDVTVYPYNGFDHSLEKNALVLRASPRDEDSFHKLSHMHLHPTDYASLSMIRKTIPNHKRRINLRVDINGVTELISVTKDETILDKMVTIHPGKWWPSKTFPVQWWNEIIKGLVDNNIPVALIGKTIDENQGFLDVDVPEGVFDFRDLTSLDGMISLISLSPVLLTNDSSPIHVAGAFDNWIVTFATAKLDDHIFPYRYGTQHYKTVNLCKELLMDDLDMDWFDEKYDSIDMIPEGKSIEDYLPEPTEVIEAVKIIYDNKLDDNWRLKYKEFNIYNVLEEIKENN